jgi:hypothetical protein
MNTTLRSLVILLGNEINEAIAYENLNMAATKMGVLLGIYAALFAEDYQAVSSAYDFARMELTDPIAIIAISDDITRRLSSM